MVSITLLISGVPIVSVSADNNVIADEKEFETISQEETTHYGWLFENGDWYYYDESGQKVTGWRLINSQYYYMYGKCLKTWRSVNSTPN